MWPFKESPDAYFVSSVEHRIEARRMYYVANPAKFEIFVAGLAEVFFFEHVEVRITAVGWIFDDFLVSITCNALVHTYGYADGRVWSIIPDIVRQFFGQIDAHYILATRAFNWRIIGRPKHDADYDKLMLECL